MRTNKTRWLLYFYSTYFHERLHGASVRKNLAPAILPGGGECGRLAPLHSDPPLEIARPLGDENN
jgi:hypothetical protein